MAGTGIRIIPIVPKRPIINAQIPTQVSNEIRRMGQSASAKLRKYPPAKPWTSRPPATGPRAGGRRTGALGRSWELRFFTGGFEVVTKIPYGSFVQGPRGQQTGVMAARGWLSVTTAGDELQKEFSTAMRKAFSQRR